MTGAPKQQMVERLRDSLSGRLAVGAAVLWAVNATLCWPLFRTEYLNRFDSNEGTFIAFATFLLKHWPHVRWFPWFNCGMPYEATYLPLVPALTAAGAWLTGAAPALAFHFIAATTYSLAPVTLFLLGVRLSKRIAPAFVAALLWSLLSPSTVIPNIRADLGSALALRRLQTIVVYGEVPHNVAICLFPLALIAVVRYLEWPAPRKFAVAALAVALVMSSNAFGVVAVAISAILLVAIYDERSWRRLPAVAAILLCGYLLICRILPPSVLSTIAANSQQVAGDYRFTTRALLTGVTFFVALVVASRIVLRCSDRLLRFAILFLVCFGGITLLAQVNLSFLPQPARYHLEMEMGICLVAGALWRRYPIAISKSARAMLWACAAVATVWVAAQDFQFSRRVIRSADINKEARVREALWIGAHLPGERLMASGEAEFWLDDFTENPQMSGGHEPTAVNWMQRVAVYTIYTGQNAGDRDGPVSLLWLKAFGCGAVTVPGPASGDPYRPFWNPAKFDGLLPLLWREGGESVYRVPLRAASLAHVIPASSVVARRPANGLDTADVETYVDALEDASVPAASIQWLNPEHARIDASLAPGQVVSVQTTYDRGWRATMGSDAVAVSPDQLGMMVLAPKCTGRCSLDLRFTEGPQRLACTIICAATAVLMLTMLTVRK